MELRDRSVLYSYLHASITRQASAKEANQCSTDFESGVRMAVNIDGDSDSTGSIAGQILGVLYGVEAIPEEWLRELELREVIGEAAEDFIRLNDGTWTEDTEEYWAKRYPPG